MKGLQRISKITNLGRNNIEFRIERNLVGTTSILGRNEFIKGLQRIKKITNLGRDYNELRK